MNAYIGVCCGIALVCYLLYTTKQGGSLLFPANPGSRLEPRDLWPLKLMGYVAFWFIIFNIMR